jgi:hypothetical protein
MSSRPATVGKYTYYRSTRKDKKLMTILPDGTVIHFGGDPRKNIQHYFDKTGLLDKKLNHLDVKRRENYLNRSANIKNKQGKLTRNDPKSANYHARRVLW